MMTLWSLQAGRWRKPKLQIRKHLRKAALSLRKILAKSYHIGLVQHLGLNNCCDNTLIQIILNIHLLLRRGIIVMEKLLEGVFLFLAVFLELWWDSSHISLHDKRWNHRKRPQEFSSVPCILAKQLYVSRPQRSFTVRPKRLTWW